MKTELITLFTQGDSSIDYDSSVPCLIARHVGFQTTEEFKQFLNRGLELTIEKKEIHGKIAWIPDLSQTDVFAEEAFKWAAEDWNARALNNGIKYVAFLMSEDDDALSNMNIETYQEETSSKMGDSFISKNFKDEELAKEWLRRVLNED